MAGIYWRELYCSLCDKVTKHRHKVDLKNDNGLDTEILTKPNLEWECWACRTKGRKSIRKAEALLKTEEKNIIEKEREWKEAIRSILDSVGITKEVNRYANIYSELIRAHKKIFGKEHDVCWLSGISRAQLDTNILIRIFCMLKYMVIKDKNAESEIKDKGE